MGPPWLGAGTLMVPGGKKLITSLDRGSVFWRPPTGSHQYRMTAAPSRHIRARPLSEVWEQEAHLP
jgi:hypothetical protein